MTLGRLLYRNLFKHPVRTVLTMLSALVAVFLLVMLRSLVTTLNAAVMSASTHRIVTQSAVSLFINLPESYKVKIEAVPGVEAVSRFNWFGGYYREKQNFFAEFATDVATFVTQYPEIKISEAEQKAFIDDRRGCIVGRQLARKYGWKVGDTIPLIGAIYPKADGSAWEFTLRGIYVSTRANVDENTMYFHYEYLDESRKSGASLGPAAVGIFLIKTLDGVDGDKVSESIDALFKLGPQRTRTQTEAMFNQGFVSMMGNIPLLLMSIGLAVVFAVSLTVTNAMLISARERVRDVGVLKALGFSSGTTGWLFIAESVIVAGVGGGAGVLLGLSSAKGIRDSFASQPFMQNFSTYSVLPETVVYAVLLTIAVGLVAGIVPAITASRVKPVDALRMEI